MKEVTRRLQIPFKHSPTELWAVVADTPRWGEAIGFPRFQVREEFDQHGHSSVIGFARLGGVDIEWVEATANWVVDKWFEQIRVFKGSPLKSMATRADISETSEGSLLSFEVRMKPRSVIGYLVSRQMLKKLDVNVSKLLGNADMLIRSEHSHRFLTDFQFSTGSSQRAENAIKVIDQSLYGHGLARKIIEHIGDSQEVELSRMRPLALAKQWKVDSHQLIECFLQSVRSGILESSWEILCPRCRVPKSVSKNMSEIPDGIHCETCNIDYDRDFASNVELSFSPSPSIRKIESGHFCFSGPGVFKHIKCQITLNPGEHKKIPVTWDPGDYRIRSLESVIVHDFSQSESSATKLSFENNKIHQSAGKDSKIIELINSSESILTIIIEDRNWLDAVLTADQVTTIQAFRDLFSDQVLRPGDEIRLRNITFMFTDLVGSTSQFESLGDAEAFNKVRQFFIFLADIIRKHQGSLVKTMGDGVHAAFLTPETALKAAIEMQKTIEKLNMNEGHQDISMRIGLNSGSSLSVTLNNQLDYYGSTVNMAARLEGLGESGEISMLQSFADDPVVAELLGQHSTSQIDVSLKGFDQPVKVLKMRVLN